MHHHSMNHWHENGKGASLLAPAPPPTPLSLLLHTPLQPRTFDFHGVHIGDSRCPACTRSLTQALCFLSCSVTSVITRGATAMRRCVRRPLVAVVVLLVLTSAPGCVEAQTYTMLVSFTAWPLGTLRVSAQQCC
jgi:hypothetical protein